MSARLVLLFQLLKFTDGFKNRVEYFVSNLSSDIVIEVVVQFCRKSEMCRFRIMECKNGQNLNIQHSCTYLINFIIPLTL
jgi:hypothetical protein